MNILCDFHHSDLWWSHHLIFEKALGHTLFRPRGMEWFEKGYYYRKSPDVAKQFLVDSMFPVDGAVDPRTRCSMDTRGGCSHYPLMKTLSLEEFSDAPIDAIMATLSENQDPWHKLRNERKPKAKLIRENGNLFGWATMHPAYKNLLTSDLPTFERGFSPNRVLYHQRFDTENVFFYREQTCFDRITCFMPGFRGVPELVRFANQHDFRPFDFVDYGHHSPLGFLSPKKRFAEEMAASSFVWHVKPGGDGFGHVLHNAIAMGRPVITKARDYNKSIAWPLLEDGLTCIFVDDHPLENSRKIRSLSDPDTIITMSRAAKARFRDVVNYDAEAKIIDLFLEKLI